MLVSRTGRGVSVDVGLERLDTFLFNITYEQFFEEVNLIRRTERSNEHSRTSGLSGLAVYEWPDTTEAILIRAGAPARYAPDVVGGQRLILRSRSSGHLFGTAIGADQHIWQVRSVLCVVKTTGLRLRAVTTL